MFDHFRGLVIKQNTYRHYSPRYSNEFSGPLMSWELTLWGIFTIVHELL